MEPIPGKDALSLEVSYFANIDHWRWRLTDENGGFLTDHEVTLNPKDREYSGFRDLERYLAENKEPDRWPDDEARQLDVLGAWIGRQVFGPIGEQILRHGTPATVRVAVPPRASSIIYTPLELGHARGRPLVLQDVSLAYEVVGENPAILYKPVTEKVRMLAIFSLPADVAGLALRRERFELDRALRRIAQTHSVEVDLRVLQYGVTREALADAIEEGEGWDIIHFSGHGMRNGLVLELPDGSEDVVDANEIVEILRPARGRLKLVTLSSCLSAATTVEETLRWLGIQSPRSIVSVPLGDNERTPRWPGVARALVRDLDCVILAMRYPIGDDFAIALGREVYELILGKGQSITRALQLALPKTLKQGYGPGMPPRSLATPALFGRRTANLVFKLPVAKTTTFATSLTGLAFFPPEPERFVGRAAQMARACAAFAPESGKTGILFFGMPGAGKTACALELAYRYAARRFSAFVWYKAPNEGSEIHAALLNLAQAMEAQLPDLKMVHVADRVEEFHTWLPHLTQVLQDHSILIVLDNVESLLTVDGQWKDDRWSWLVQTLLAHNGQSRTVLTSRRAPVFQGKEDCLLVEAIHSLSLDEVALLAREMPNMGRMLLGKTSVELSRGRELVLRTLSLVQGHPELVRLADAQAGDPNLLADEVERASSNLGIPEDRLRAFFATGESRLEPAEFLAALAGWTQQISGRLPSACQILFHLLCALEEEDRGSDIIQNVWHLLWVKQARPGPIPDFVETMASLASSGLVQAGPFSLKKITYRIHPGVAGAGRTESGKAFQENVDEIMADFWGGVLVNAEQEEVSGLSPLVLRSARSDAEYLVRLRRWAPAATAIDQVLRRTDSPSTTAAVLPVLRHLAAEARGGKDELVCSGVLARALVRARRWEEAEPILRGVLTKSLESRNFRFATAAAGDLVGLLRDQNRVNEALQQNADEKKYVRLAGLGPWSQMSTESQRLKLLMERGQHEVVLTTVESLRQQMDHLPNQSEQEESVHPWAVREIILGIGSRAATFLERWEDAIALNSERIASTKSRVAPPSEVARALFDNWGPLIRLSRPEHAREILNQCKAIWEKEGDIHHLSLLFNAQATLESSVGETTKAIDLGKTALRYAYVSPNAENCALFHYNLARNLVAQKKLVREGLVHWLAAGIMLAQLDSSRLDSFLKEFPDVIKHVTRANVLPTIHTSFDDICRGVEMVEGVRFQELFNSLPRHIGIGDEALKTVIEYIGTLSRDPRRTNPRGLARRKTVDLRFPSSRQI